MSAMASFVINCAIIVSTNYFTETIVCLEIV